MELHLNITRADNVTIRAIREIVHAIKKAGFEVEVVPTEIAPRLIKVTSAEAAVPTEEVAQLVPKTYGDWVDLAEDIKAKYPDDPVMRANVNYFLQQIAQEAEDSRKAEESRRWFIKIAGELGIG